MLRRVAVVMTLATLPIAASVFARDDDPRNMQFGWALVSRGSTLSTSVDELNRMEEWTSDGDRVLFARFGEDEYLIRDRAVLDRVDELVEPIRKLGEEVREIRPSRDARRSDRHGKREWKERLRPFKEKRRELLLQVSDEIEALARDAIRRGRAQRLR